MRAALPLLTAALLALALPRLAVAQATALPDLERGKRALAAGDFGAAQRDLEPLARMGYLEAQLRLASAYAKLETPAGDRQAVGWYRTALPRAPELRVRLARALLRLAAPAEEGKPLTAPQTELLIEAETLLRKAHSAGDAEALLPLLALLTAHPERDTQPQLRVATLLAKAENLGTPEAESALIRWYRLNQNPDQSRHAAQLVRLCQKALDRIPECVVDLARHYRPAEDDKALDRLVQDALARQKKGQMPPELIERLGNALLSDNVAGKPQPKLAFALLKTVADKSTPARVRVARLLLEQPELDPDTKPAALLESAVAEGSPEAALSLARLYQRGIDVTVEPATAERLLLQAVASEPSAHFFLGRMYQRGELGEAQPLKAAEHYLQAARSGYARADLAMAQLYSENRGVQVNLLNAYLFARLAANGAVPEAGPLIETLRPQINDAVIDQAEEQMAVELALRAEAAQRAQQAPPKPVLLPAAPARDKASAHAQRTPAIRLTHQLDPAHLARDTALQSSPSANPTTP